MTPSSHGTVRCITPTLGKEHAEVVERGRIAAVSSPPEPEDGHLVEAEGVLGGVSALIAVVGGIIRELLRQWVGRGGEFG